jgi:hypothetical protein
VLTTSDDGTARVWRSGVDVSLGALLPDATDAGRAVFVASDERVDADTSDRIVQAWPTVRRELEALAHQRADRGDGPEGERQERALARSHDGRLVVVTASPHPRYTSDLLFTAVIRERGTGHEIARLGKHANAVRGAAFSPDDRLVATVSGTDPSIGASDWALRIWEASDGTLVQEARHQHGMRGVWFSRDGRWVFTASERGGTVTVWRTDTWESVVELSGHADLVNSVASSHDGRLVVTASKDQTARVWALQEGTELLALRGHVAEIQAAVFSPDDELILTMAADGSVKAFACVVSGDLEHRLRLARAWTTRSLSPAERERFLHEPLTAADASEMPSS